MEDQLFHFLSYSIGTLVGLLIARLAAGNAYARVIDMLIDRGFLKYKEDENGNIIILKWNS